jgi:hypothetical protein
MYDTRTNKGRYIQNWEDKGLSRIQIEINNCCQERDNIITACIICRNKRQLRNKSLFIQCNKLCEHVY